ncbi:methionyl-tRNA formyltransferase [Halocynthiibacter styelae]|uniref:Methionyl-tRNA formyltransferase n=1 Tax=Halocynthiibacter styelae TaxID=2761955 RepID=A0A8J7IC45_9RHOB|nr:methionyl-tRNA formyltransferase [Paenihalocynthiibacter styelae]MBI1492898.1 methionyl-tRNA formyltransferase [Paenihalocynthiibacter styelae]
MRVIFMGSPDFSVSALDALIDAGHEIACVYCQPPRPAGRGKKDRPTAVQARAEELGLLVRHPLNFKDPADVAAFAELKADIAVVVAYGLILPQSILDAPSKGCLNIHASLLPRWRGAAPIHRAIMAGDEKSGVCIMQMDAGLDTGDVLLRDELVIGATETTADLHDRLAVMGAGMIVQSLEKYDDLSPAPQLEEGVNYAHKIDKAEAQIDWSRPAVEIDRQIRGLSPFPGAWCMLGKDRLKLLGSELAEGAGAAGEVLDDQLLIACGEGAVRLTRLQRAGKGAQDAEVFQRGKPIEKGTVL